MPPITVHPSYFHPVGSGGRARPTAGVPELRFRNHTPLRSLVLSPSVGVARMYVPVAAVKALPSAAASPTVSAASPPATFPAAMWVAVGAGSGSLPGSTVI